MMKTDKYIRTAAALLAVLFCVALWDTDVYAEEAAPEEPTEWIEITTPEQLRDIRSAPSANYRLTADLDMAQVQWIPVAFSGTFDGGGHTLYNLNVIDRGNEVRTTADGNLKKYETTFAGLFSTAEHAAITDLHLMGAQISVENEESCFAAILAGYVENCTISRCTVNGRVSMISRGINVGVGGLVGYGIADFDACGADVELFLEDRQLEAHCEQFMGGVLASGTGDITNCTVTIDGYDSCHGYVHNGGLVGMYFNCGKRVWPGVVNDNRVEGQISFFEDNPHRRAYCSAYLGERLQPPNKLEGNTHQFTRNETMDYSVVLRPERCDAPQYRVGVTPPTCTEWGHTDHLCQTCGHAWTDEYTPPRHTPGTWEIVTAATEESEGLRQKYCSMCGELLAEETIPVVVPQPEREAATLPMIWLGAGVAVAAVAVVGVGIAVRRKVRQRTVKK